MLQVQVILDHFPSLQPEQIIVRDIDQYSHQLQLALEHVDKEGFDIVLDAISGEYFQPSYQAMARGGRHVIFGAANWTPTGDLGLMQMNASCDSDWAPLQLQVLQLSACFHQHIEYCIDVQQDSCGRI